MTPMEKADGGSMTTAAPVRWPFPLRHRPAALWRALAAGIAWGLVTSTGFTAMDAWRCGFVCLDAAAVTAMASIVVGILTIGPLAAFGRGSSAVRG